MYKQVKFFRPNQTKMLAIVLNVTKYDKWSRVIQNGNLFYQLLIKILFYLIGIEQS